MNLFMQISPLLVAVNAVHHSRNVRGNVSIISHLTFFKQSNKGDILLFACQLSAKFGIKLVSEDVHVCL